MSWLAEMMAVSLAQAAAKSSNAAPDCTHHHRVNGREAWALYCARWDAEIGDRMQDNASARPLA